MTTFGVLGGDPGKLSQLARKSIESLQAAGHDFVLWVPGQAEPAWPWDLHRPTPWSLPRPSADLRQVDFLLQLDRADPSAEMFASARHGVWRLTTSNPGPPAFWEVFDGVLEIELRLDRLIPGDPQRRISLGRRWIKTNLSSYADTLHQAVEEWSLMPAYAAARDLDAASFPVAFAPETHQEPSSTDLLRMRAKLLRRVLRDQTHGILFAESWKVGVVDAPIHRFLELDYLPSVRWLPNPGSKRFLADPFLASTSEGLLLMAEEYDFDTQRGRIVGELAKNGTLTGHMQDAIVEDCHMSYPFLLEHEGALYCIPETHQKDGAFAWRRDQHRWTDPRPVITGRAVIDPTPIFFDGRWWLFFTDKVDGVDSKLQICYADQPWGPWEPHARNPVKVDIRSSRPGGTPFVYRGELYRPAQDSSKHYGWRLMLNKVTKLSPTEFAEEIVRVVDSDRLGVDGVHTLSGSGETTVIDARHAVFAYWQVSRLLLHKARLLLKSK